MELPEEEEFADHRPAEICRGDVAPRTHSFREDTAGQGYPYKPNRVDGLLLLVRGVSTRLNLRSEVLSL